MNGVCRPQQFHLSRECGRSRCRTFEMDSHVRLTRRLTRAKAPEAIELFCLHEAIGIFLSHKNPEAQVITCRCFLPERVRHGGGIDAVNVVVSNVGLTREGVTR